MAKTWTGRSDHEDVIGLDLITKGVHFDYEKESFNWYVEGWYTQDFWLPSGRVVEAKGYFRKEAQKVIRAVKELHPDLDLAMLFEEKDRGRKVPGCKKLTYEQWGEKYGIPVAFGTVPEEWL